MIVPAAASKSPAVASAILQAQPPTPPQPPVAPVPTEQPGTGRKYTGHPISLDFQGADFLENFRRGLPVASAHGTGSPAKMRSTIVSLVIDSASAS